MDSYQHLDVSAAPFQRPRAHHALRRGAHALEELQRDAFERSCTQWPAVNFTFEDFREYLTGLGYTDELPGEVVSLFLCGACALAVPAAHRTLERTYFRSLRAEIARFFKDGDAIEDVLQNVRYRLFVGPSPRIGCYRGSGPLAVWLRKVAQNAARDHVRKSSATRQRIRRYEQSAAILATDENLHNVSPEDRLWRTQLTASCEGALLAGVRSMRSEDRQILRYYFAEGMSIDEIGTIYSVDRSTAARRINRALEKLRSEFRRALGRTQLERYGSMLVATHALQLTGYAILGRTTDLAG